MELVYSNQQLFLVTNAKNILQAAGIDAQIKNEFIAGAAGDISPFDAWPELWVEARHVRQAKQLISTMDSDEAPDWRCNQCGEENGSAFDLCWHCDKPFEDTP